MSYKVTNVREVNYIGMNEEERKKIWRLDDLRMQQMTTDFFDEDEYFALYEDLNNNLDCATNDATYAVYMKKSGELLCLLVDAGVALNGCDDYNYYCEREKLYKQIAMAAGWPEKMVLSEKKRYTVRIIRILDMEVYAKDALQAKVIGKKIERHINGECSDKRIKSALDDRPYELDKIWDAPPEDEGVWDLAFSASECEDILNMED